MIVIGWKKIPDYAIDCINGLTIKENILVITDKKIPKKKIKKFSAKNIDLNKNYNWSDISSDKPSHFFFTGWDSKAFISLAKSKKTKNICMIDNIKKNTFRQYLGKVYFRLFFKRIFDAVFVPGVQSRDFLKYLGFEKKIYKGFYSCNEKIFKNTTRIVNRKYDFIYVGQFIHRKNILGLISAFKQIRDKLKKKVKLRMIGQNRFLSISEKNITTLSFQNSKKIAKYLNNSKCLVLPSYEEHWGVVIHEAISCGCAIILSNKVGSRNEFLKKNGFCFDINSHNDLFIKMRNFTKLKKIQLTRMSINSIKLSKKRSIKFWNSQFLKIINDLS